MSRPAVEQQCRQGALRRTAVLAALGLLGLALCFAGCRPRSGRSATQLPTQLSPIRLDSTAEVESTEVQPGQPVTFLVSYRVRVPPGQNALNVTVTLRPLFNQQPLPERSFRRVLKTGNSHHSFSYLIPVDAAKGRYEMEIVTSQPQPEPGRQPVTAYTKKIFEVVRPSKQ
jgi:hypothetical protein